ncbi:MAG: protease modulator HflK [Gemmatimonadetes bacterium]|nr:protease modulator HflK [Gemmatimonadota bacterium]
MRRRSAGAEELSRLAAPVARAADTAWRRIHWWILTMVVVYAFSGITVVRQDETALVLRWGRLVGSTAALQEHGPGLLFALPRPIDEVVRVRTRQISEVTIGTLTSGGVRPSEEASQEGSPNESHEGEPPPMAIDAGLDPLREGYAITGDHNIVQLTMVARYRVREPATFFFYGPEAHDVLRVEVTAAMLRSIGEMRVDQVLSDGRKDLIATASRRAQDGLDSARSGLELTSLELTSLGPPAALTYDFAAVQTAFIGAETSRKDALAFSEAIVPASAATTDASVQAARATAASELALATGEAAAFRALAREYRANAPVVRERLYRDAIERALSTARVMWIPPPPPGGNHSGMRITVNPQGVATPMPGPPNH